MNTSRLVIYPKDVQRITGKTYNQARIYLNGIKGKLGKQPHQLISISEFCDFTSLPLAEVSKYIG